MSEDKKRDDAARITDEELQDVSGGTKYSNITLKRGYISSVDPSDPSSLTTGEGKVSEPDGVTHQDNWDVSR